MKRFLVIVLFLLILTAAWFRWFDEIDPATVKAEIADQKVVFKEKMADFSLKKELSQISETLDAFFSPKDVLENQEYVFEYQNEDFLLEDIVEDPETFFASEEEALLATEEVPVEATNIPTEVEASVEVVSNAETGYPAPMMAPVTIVDPTEVVEDIPAQEEMVDQTAEVVVEENPTVTEDQNVVVTDQPSEVSADPNLIVAADDPETSDTTMVFNQLQESIPGSFLPYNLQSVEPIYTTNFAHPELGCDWMGVAGQIFDENQQPVNGLVVVVEGVTNNTMVELLGFSGLAEMYGPGGYELVLSDVNGPGIFWIQLFGEDGEPLSEIYSFQMDGTCEQNLAVINFTVKTEVQSKFVPTVNP